MASQNPHRRRAFSPDQYQVQKAISSAALGNSGKKPPASIPEGLDEHQIAGLPKIQHARPMRGVLVERTKVVGVLEEDEDGNVYMSQFASKAEPDLQPGEEPTDDEVETEKASWICPIVKAEEANDLRLVTGVVLEPETVDAQKDIYDATVIRNAAHDFLREYNAGTVIGFMHKDMNRSLDLVESWCAPTKMKLGDREIKKGTWLMTVHVVDENIWKSVKEGKIAGFSIGGIAKVQRLDEKA